LHDGASDEALAIIEGGAVFSAGVIEGGYPDVTEGLLGAAGIVGTL
jgi:hypothetical protein